MTISTTTSKVGYNGNGVTTAFSVPFLFLANADLTVVLLSSAGVETTLTLSTHYTVTGAGNDSGGTLTMVTPPAIGERLTILREVALTQETDYISGDPFPAETHERALDRLTMIDQQQEEVLSRAMTLPVSDAASAALPTKAMRAGKYLAFDVDGNAVAVSGTSSSIVVTPFMEGLLDDADAAAAQTTLNVPSRNGSNASGTWGISITGNAATATDAGTLDGIDSTGFTRSTGISELGSSARTTANAPGAFSGGITLRNAGGGAGAGTFLDAVLHNTPVSSIGFKDTGDGGCEVGMSYTPPGDTNTDRRVFDAFRLRNDGICEAKGFLPTGGVGAVGTYALLFSSSNITYGTSYAGSGLRAQAANRAGDNVLSTGNATGTTMSGTWQALTGGGSGNGALALFLRIS